MRNIASVLLCALLVLQVTSFMVKDLADSVSQIDHESQNPIQSHLQDLLKHMRKDNSVALNYEENPLNIAYGWRGKMKIVRYLASLTVDIDLKANIGKKQMTFSGAAAGAFANPNFEGIVFGSFLVNPEELFGKNAFAMTYDTKQIPNVGSIKGIVIGISKLTDPTNVLGVIISPAQNQEVSAFGQGTLKEKEL